MPESGTSAHGAVLTAAIIALLATSWQGTDANAQNRSGSGNVDGKVATLPSITMDVAPGAGTLDDRFVATVRVALIDIASLEHYEPPALDDFELVDHRSDRTTADHYQPGQGRIAAVFLTYRYTLAAKRTGVLRIGSARARISGADYRTGARGIEVKDVLDQIDSPTSSQTPRPAPRPTPHRPGPPVSPPTTGPDPGASDGPGSLPEIFVRVHADKTAAYVGEQITVTWTLFTRHEIIEIEPDMPRMDDFWSEILFEPSTFSSHRDDVVGGVRYKVFTVSRRALFPLRPGSLVLAPYRATVATLYTPLGKRVDVVGEPLTIEAKPLPEGAPDGFNPSFVGRFRLSAAIDRPRVELGQPFTLTLVVKGHGAIRRTGAPVLSFPDFDIEMPREFKESVQTTDKSVLGQRIYRYLFTARKLGPQTIPAIEIPFFDPMSGRYSGAKSRALDIEVLPVGSSPDGEDASATGAGAQTGDLDESRGWSTAVAVVVTVIAVAVVIVLWIGVLAVRRSRSHQRPAASASSSPHSYVTERLQAAEEHVQARRTSELFAELTRILEHYISQHSKSSTGLPTRDQRLAQWRTDGADPSLLARVEEELDLCDLARFAASRVTEDDMRAAVTRVRQLARELDEHSATAK